MYQTARDRLQNIYRGWRIWRGPDYPVTGQWRAVQWGVTMNAGTREALERMIDVRVEEALGRKRLNLGWFDPLPVAR